MDSYARAPHIGINVQFTATLKMMSPDEVIESRMLGWTVNSESTTRYLPRDTKLNYSHIIQYYRFTDRDFILESPEFVASARATL